MSLKGNAMTQLMIPLMTRLVLRLMTRISKATSLSQPLALAALLVLNGCAESKFGANGAKKGNDDATPKGTLVIPGAETVNIAEPFVVKNGDLELEFDPGNDDRETGEKRKRPLTIYFALDVTGSMDAIIEAIKTNINQFVTQLQSKDFDPMVGIVTFTDTVDKALPLTKDISSFQSFVGGLRAMGGGDAQEASLAAVEDIIKRLETEETRENAVRTILTITDNPGHRGGPSMVHGAARDNCGIAETAAAFNGISKDRHSYYRLYHSMAPSNWPRVQACGGFSSGQDQYNQLLTNIFPDVPQADRGAALSWPFTGDTLLTDFVAKLEEIKPDRNLVCLARSANLIIDDKVYSKWAASDLAETYKSFSSGKTLKFDQIIKKADLAKVQSEGGKLKVKRCCLVRTDAEAGNFETCVKEPEQIVEFRVKIK